MEPGFAAGVQAGWQVFWPCLAAQMQKWRVYVVGARGGWVCWSPWTCSPRGPREAELLNEGQRCPWPAVGLETQEGRTRAGSSGTWADVAASAFGGLRHRQGACGVLTPPWELGRSCSQTRYLHSTSFTPLPRTIKYMTESGTRGLRHLEGSVG